MPHLRVYTSQQIRVPVELHSKWVSRHGIVQQELPLRRKIKQLPIVQSVAVQHFKYKHWLDETSDIESSLALEISGPGPAML